MVSVGFFGESALSAKRGKTGQKRERGALESGMDGE